MSEPPVAHVPIEIESSGRAPSPFRPGERPLFIGGRASERTAIRTWFSRSISAESTTALLLYGPRGTGKTTLSGYLAEQAVEAGWLCVGLRGDVGTAFSSQLTVLADTPGNSPSWTLGIDVGLVRASVEHAIRSAPSNPSLSDLVTRVVDQAENGVMLIVDEAQAAEQRQLAALVAVLEDLADVRRLPVAVAVLGTEKLVDVIGPTAGSLGRLHRSEHVELSIRQTRDETLDICAGTLIEHPGISLAAVTGIQDDTAGFPHAVQIYGEAAFARARGGVIESRHVDAARVETYDRLCRQVFTMMWRRQGSRGPAPMRSREYLRHVAEGEGSHTRIAELMGTAPTSLAQIRQDLIDRGALVALDRSLTLGIPLMQRFVLDQSFPER